MTEGSNQGAAPAAPLAERLMTPVVRLGGAISALLILVTLGVTTYSVFMRYVMGHQPIWADQSTGFILVALIMLGVAEGYRRGNHISIDLVIEGLPPRGQRLARLWADFCVLAFAGVLITSSWHSVQFAMDFGSYTAGSIEIASWIPQLPLLLGGALLGLFAVARLIGTLSGGGVK